MSETTFTPELPSASTVHPLAGASASRPKALTDATAYIVSPLYDWCLFLAPPVVSLLIGFLISGTTYTTAEFDFHGFEVTLVSVLIGIIIHAHIFVVFFRSHANGDIFDTHRPRFVLVPLFLFGAMILSSWILVACSVLATFWDVYHSGLQTFGFGRLYDKKAGNTTEAGRTLDLWLNSLFYAGPIVAGATMMDHFEDFYEFEDVGATFFTKIPVMMTSYQGWLAYGLIGFGTLFTAYYLYAYWRMAQDGYQVSWLKTWLYASTGLTSVYTWGFNSFGEAFFIMNLFHAVQYFGLVWWSENKNLPHFFGVAELPFAKGLTFLLFIGTAFSYGYFVEWIDADIRPLVALTLTVSLMHFWYDGFIWSVRKKQV